MRPAEITNSDGKCGRLTGHMCAPSCPLSSFSEITTERGNVRECDPSVCVALLVLICFGLQQAKAIMYEKKY